MAAGQSALECLERFDQHRVAGGIVHAAERRASLGDVAPSALAVAAQGCGLGRQPATARGEIEEAAVGMCEPGVDQVRVALDQRGMSGH